MGGGGDAIDRTQRTNTEHTAPRPIPAQRGSRAPLNPGFAHACFDSSCTESASLHFQQKAEGYALD